VPASLHVVWSSFPMMGDRTRTTGGSAHEDPVTLRCSTARLKLSFPIEARSPRFRGHILPAQNWCRRTDFSDLRLALTVPF
jgi:hypothetical protein